MAQATAVSIIWLCIAQDKAKDCNEALVMAKQAMTAEIITSIVGSSVMDRSCTRQQRARRQRDPQPA